MPLGLACGVVLVGWLSSSIELGVFRVALACAVLAAMPVTVFHILLAPSLSRLHASGNRIEMQRLLTSLVPHLTPMDALRTVVSALAETDPDVRDMSLPANRRNAVRLTG